MSNIHFAFFVNVTPLLVDALDGFMLTKPYAFKTAQIWGLIDISEPQVLRQAWTKNQGDTIQRNPNSSKWSQTILFDNRPKVL